MFYSMPRDILQAYASKELHTRGWRFHKELRLWFSRDNTANGSQPQFVYFDSNCWEKRIFDGSLPSTGFMTDADMNFESNNQANQPNQPNQSNQPNQPNQPPTTQWCFRRVQSDTDLLIIFLQIVEL